MSYKHDCRFDMVLYVNHYLQLQSRSLAPDLWIFAHISLSAIQGFLTAATEPIWAAGQKSVERESPTKFLDEINTAIATSWFSTGNNK